MFRRVVMSLMLLGAIAVVVGTASQAVAADKSHDGMVVSVAEGKFVMTDKDGKNEHTMAVGATTKVTLDGKEAKLADLKKGDKVTVKTGEGDKVTSVAATRAKN